MPSYRNSVFSQEIKACFGKEKMTQIYQVVIVFLSLSLFLCWPKKPFRFFLALTATPPTFSIMIITVFIMTTYLSVRFGLESGGRQRLKSIADWKSIMDLPIRCIAIGKSGVFLVHSLFLSALVLPFLVVAASPSGVSPTAVFSSLLVVFTCTLSYCIVAFSLLLIFKKRPSLAGWLSWTIVFFLCFASLYLFPEASPALNLLSLAGASPEKHQSFQAFGITVPYRVGTLHLHIIIGLASIGAAVLGLAIRRRLHYHFKEDAVRGAQEDGSHG